MSIEKGKCYRLVDVDSAEVDSADKAFCPHSQVTAGVSDMSQSSSSTLDTPLPSPGRAEAFHREDDPSPLPGDPVGIFLNAISILCFAVAFWGLVLAPGSMFRRWVHGPEAYRTNIQQAGLAPGLTPRLTFGSNATPTTIPIGKVTLGRRMVAHNPLLTDEDRAAFIEPDPKTWKWVDLFHTDDQILQTRVSLLRPPAWFKELNVREMHRVFLSMPEFGVEGDVLATDISPCPKIDPGQGAIVTGTFAHQVRGSILAVTVEGMDKPITVTPNHPFWSENEQDFIEVGHMSPGDMVRIADGQLRRLTNIETRAGPSSVYWVYNLEIAGEHVYHVGQAGVTVHNKGGTGNHRRAGFALNPLARSVKNYRKTFFTKYPHLKGKVVVHHRVEQQVLNKYPGLFTEAEIHALGNLRGIPKNINAKAHLSKVRKAWNDFYNKYPKATKQQILDNTIEIDKLLNTFIG